MEKIGRVLAAVLFVVTVSVTSFYAGYTYPRQSDDVPPAPTPTAAPAAPVSTPIPPRSDRTAEERFRVFWEAWNLVEQEFYKRDAVDAERLTYGAIRGMLDALDDPHTTFADPSQARISEEDMRGTFYGVGIQLEDRDGELTVITPLDDTPAQRAGIKAGDVILSVDGKLLKDIALGDAVNLIRGPDGTKVRLTVKRPGVHDPLTFDLVRGEIRTVVVKAEMLEGNIGYVKLNMFTATSAPDLQRALRRLVAQKPVGIVLDLRNNPGGLLHSAVDVTSQFLKSGVVLVEEHRDGRVESFYVRPGGVATEVPLVVLVNKGSASASEIVAGALQDHGRAIVIGERTYGKATVQNIHKLSDTSSVRITFAQWWTPRRQDLNRKGLTPDFVIPLTEEDREANADPQLRAAVSHLQQGLAKRPSTDNAAP